MDQTMTPPNQLDDISDLVVGPPSPTTGAVNQLDDISDLVRSDLLPVQMPKPGEQRPIMQDALSLGGVAVREAGSAYLGIKGAGVGATVGAPLGPPGVIGGAIAGGIAGYLSGDVLADFIGLPEVKDLPKDLRPAGYFVQSVSGGVPFSRLPVQWAKQGKSFDEFGVIGKGLNAIIDTARIQPKRYAAYEMGALTSAGSASAGAEILFPGQEGVRIGAEVVGGITNPVGRTVQLGNFGAKVVRRAYESMSEAGKETAAGRFIADYARELDNSPGLANDFRLWSEVIRRERIPGTEGATPAQITGSEVLAGVERALATKNIGVRGDIARRSNEATDAVRAQIELLTSTGDPEALRAAAELRAAYFRTLIQNRLDEATNEAIESVRKLTSEIPASDVQKFEVAASEAASKAFREVIEQADEKMDELWAAVRQDVPAEITSLKSEYQSLLREHTEEFAADFVPTKVRDFIARMEKDGATSGEIIKFRSDMLKLARGYARSTDEKADALARSYSRLAEALLDDVDAAFSTTADMSYQTARDFTREYHNTFTRSFIGEAMVTTKYGDRVPAEILLKRAFASGGDKARMNFADLEYGTRFMTTIDPTNPDIGSMAAMKEAQGLFLRAQLARYTQRTVDPKTGVERITISEKPLENFSQKNRLLLEQRFPEIDEAIKEALKTERGRRNMEILTQNRNQSVERSLREIFGSSTNLDPVRAATQAINSPNPDKAITALTRMIQKRADPNEAPVADLIAGFRSSILTAAIKQSQSNGMLDPGKFKRLLTTPRVAGGKSVVQSMMDNGLLSADEYRQMGRVFNLIDNLAAASAPGGQANLEKAGGFINDLMGRFFGSWVVKKITPQPTIQQSGAGAAAGRAFTARLPITTLEDTLVTMLNNPESAARILDKAAKLVNEPRLTQARQMNAWLIQWGLGLPSEAIEAEGQ